MTEETKNTSPRLIEAAHVEQASSLSSSENLAFVPFDPEAPQAGRHAFAWGALLTGQAAGRKSGDPAGESGNPDTSPGRITRPPM